MSDKQENSIELDDERERTNSAAAKPVELVKDADGFVSWLNQRMKVAEWDTYERGSDAFFDIESDLEKLGKQDIDLARSLWKENAPPGMKLPVYLDPELDKSGAATRPGDEKDAGEKNRSQGAKNDRGEAEKEEGYKVPETIKRRYLEADNRFFFRDEKNKLAFEDRGRKLTTEHNDPDVAKSLVEIAEAKGWTKIKATGHEDFKREIWLQGQLKGIEVTGYKAKAVDQARLKELQSERMKNAVERDDSREPAKGKAAERVPDEEKAYGTPAYSKAENFRGKLLEHGEANYDFDAKKDQSYYVKIETENGVRMHWGVGLRDAMDHAGAKIGEMIELERLGKRPVTVQEKQFDAQGNLIGHKPVESERIEWSINGIDQSKNVAKLADPVVNGSTAKTVSIEKKHPSLDLPKADLSQIKGPQNAHEQLAAEGAKLLVKAAGLGVQAQFAEDYGTRESEQNKAARVQKDAYSKLAAVAPERAKELVDVERSKLNDRMVQGAAAFDPAKHQAAVAEQSKEVKTTPAKAPALTGDYKVVANVMEKVLKAEGISPAVLKRANAKAAEILKEMAATGKPAPGVKVFDRNAERSKPREKVQTKTKEQQQERSR